MPRRLDTRTEVLSTSGGAVLSPGVRIPVIIIHERQFNSQDMQGVSLHDHVESELSPNRKMRQLTWSAAGLLSWRFPEHPNKSSRRARSSGKCENTYL